MKKRIIISGATGFIGKELVTSLITYFEIVVLSTNAEKAKGIFNAQVEVVDWNDKERLINFVRNAYGIINLSGASIAAKRWTKKRKRLLIESRINTISKWEEILKRSGAKTEVFIQASAIGYYGNSTSTEFDENSVSKNNLFLSEITMKNEKAVSNFTNYSRRLVIPRLSLVLGASGGIVKKMILPYKLGLGVRFGKGNQWMSWIHLEDVVKIFQLFLSDNKMNGIFNLSSTSPVSNQEFHETMNNILGNKMNWVLPSFVIWLIFGQMGMETLLSGQKVKPLKLISQNYKFQFSNLNNALKNILNQT